MLLGDKSHQSCQRPCGVMARRDRRFAPGFARALPASGGSGLRKPCREPLGRAGLGDSLRLIGCCMCCRRNWAKMAEKTQSRNLFHVRFGVLHVRTVVFALQAKNIPATRFTIVVSHYRIAFFLPFLSIRPAVPLSIRLAPSLRAPSATVQKKRPELAPVYAHL